ncbi:unnamed protein product, partial [Staurois parvus]
MQRCIGIPCSAYLVLRSHDESPAASPAISSGQCRNPASMFRSLWRRGVSAANLKFLKNGIFKKIIITYALSCALPAFLLSFL